jgi:hypothetical protein
MKKPNPLKTRIFGQTAAGLLLLTGCATGLLRIQDPYHLPGGSLRLAQVAHVGSQQEINEAIELHDLLIASGLSQKDIKDGSCSIARIYCCGGLMEKIAFIEVYVPEGIRVELGDIVEVRVADPSKKGRPEQLNTVAQIRQKAGDKSGTCRWDPPDERLWTRILYADWMPGEGWKHQGGLNKAWYKPPP